jgi:class 3 adenylate cyclase/tetratricopeptide (TPR) repeat protein
LTVRRESIERISAILRQEPENLDGAQLKFLLEEISEDFWQSDRDRCLALIEHLLQSGHARDAFDLLLKTRADDDLRARQLRAFAMVKTGAPRTAAQLLRQLLDEGNDDVETLGFLAGTEKEMARSTGNAKQSVEHLRQALAYYLRAFNDTDDPYPGINAAALLIRLNDADKGRAIAMQVQGHCEAALNETNADYWTRATLGEAYLIQGNIAAAHEAYATAVSKYRTNITAIGSTYRQAKQILKDIGHPEGTLDDAFAMPEVIVFAGHRIDERDRMEPRLVSAKLERLKLTIKEYLERNNVVLGYAAAANGADILFLESILELGGQAHIVLPMDVPAFVSYSVVDREDPQWEKRFDRLLDAASSVTITSEAVDLEDDTNLDYCNRVTLGLAQLKAAELGTHVSGLAVWDGEAGSMGGTAASVALWHEHAVPMTIVDPVGADKSAAALAPQSDSPGKRKLMAMLFADVIGYSQLSEKEISTFYESVLPEVASLCDMPAHRPVVADTFGDAFYFVFDGLTDAAEFAVGLQAIFVKPGKSNLFGRQLMIRIALHAGPLLPCYDPVAKRQNFTGRHTSKTARVEPVADENQILTTQQFAALLAIEAPGRYELVYAGERSLAKRYGTERLFVLAARTEV